MRDPRKDPMLPPFTEDDTDYRSGVALFLAAAMGVVVSGAVWLLLVFLITETITCT